jgi:hypothetical protein
MKSNHLCLLFLVFTFSVLATAQTLPLPLPASIDQQFEMWARYDALVLNSAEITDTLDQQQRQNLLSLVLSNPVAALKSNVIKKWDPPANGRPGEIGYCFGRAMATHLTARKLGLAQESMKKIFAAGDMANGEIRWRFHMATLVKGSEDGQFYVIDPIMPAIIRPTDNLAAHTLTPANWIKLVRREYDNTEKTLSFYEEEKNSFSTHYQQIIDEKLDTIRNEGTIKFYITSTDAMMVDMRLVPAHLLVENGQHINEVLFTPSETEGFIHLPEVSPHIWQLENEQTLDKYFMTKNEPLVDQFNFFKLDAKINYIKDNAWQTTERNYLFNGASYEVEQDLSNLFEEFSYLDSSEGYFPSLFTNIELITESF